MFYYFCKLVCTSTALLYPLYASYKALRPPAPGQTAQQQGERLERWLMYWCVLACVWVWEEWAEWTIAWFPFYHEVKTLVILWLALPQIQGSTYIYLHHLSPFLTSHEADIDAALTDARTSATRAGLGYANAAVRRLRAAVLGSLLGQTDTNTAAAGEPPVVLANPAAGTAPGNTPAAGATSLAQLAGGLLRAYAPQALAAGQALLHPMGAAGSGSGSGSGAGALAREPLSAGGEARVRAAGAGAAGSRREELERELAALGDNAGAGAPRGSHPVSLSPATSAGRGDPVAARVAGEASLLSASSSFEEIARDEASGWRGGAAAGAAPARAGTAASAAPHSARKSGGWFGWGGQEDVSAEKKNV
ncbi:hypothetical protein JCM3770_001624 [Rhodotorula araucariae]